MMNLIEEMKALIKDEQWHNIPIPVRVTCEGIMAFQEKMTEIETALESHSAPKAPEQTENT